MGLHPQRGVFFGVWESVRESVSGCCTWFPRSIRSTVGLPGDAGTSRGRRSSSLNALPAVVLLLLVAYAGYCLWSRIVP